jgi:hypothetical protein
MNKGFKVIGIVVVASLLNKYLVRRFWPMGGTTTTTT